MNKLTDLIKLVKNCKNDHSDAQQLLSQMNIQEHPCEVDFKYRADGLITWEKLLDGCGWIRGAISWLTATSRFLYGLPTAVALVRSYPIYGLDTYLRTAVLIGDIDLVNQLLEIKGVRANVAARDNEALRALH